MAKQAGNQIACSSSAEWSGRTLNIMTFVAMHAHKARQKATKEAENLRCMLTEALSTTI